MHSIWHTGKSITQSQRQLARTESFTLYIRTTWRITRKIITEWSAVDFQKRKCQNIHSSCRTPCSSVNIWTKHIDLTPNTRNRLVATYLLHTQSIPTTYKWQLLYMMCRTYQLRAEIHPILYNTTVGSETFVISQYRSHLTVQIATYIRVRQQMML